MRVSYQAREKEKSLNLFVVCKATLEHCQSRRQGNHPARHYKIPSPGHNVYVEVRLSAGNTREAIITVTRDTYIVAGDCVITTDSTLW